MGLTILAWIPLLLFLACLVGVLLAGGFRKRPTEGASNLQLWAVLGLLVVFAAVRFWIKPLGEAAGWPIGWLVLSTAIGYSSLVLVILMPKRRLKRDNKVRTASLTPRSTFGSIPPRSWALVGTIAAVSVILVVVAAVQQGELSYLSMGTFFGPMILLFRWFVRSPEPLESGPNEEIEEAWTALRASEDRLYYLGALFFSLACGASGIGALTDSLLWSLVAAAVMLCGMVVVMRCVFRTARLGERVNELRTP